MWLIFYDMLAQFNVAIRIDILFLNQVNLECSLNVEQVYLFTYQVIHQRINIFQICWQ